jgi:hypothetical protein
MPVTGPVLVRPAKARQVRNVRSMQDRSRTPKWPLDGRPYQAQGRLRISLGARSPAGSQREPLCLRAHPGHGENARPVHAAWRVGTSPQRGSRRQPAREPRTVDSPSAIRHPGWRRSRVGARNSGTVRRGWQHLQQRSGCRLSALGGGGDRTRVLRYITRASPGAALLCFSQPRQSRRQAADGLSRCLVSRLAPRPG